MTGSDFENIILPLKDKIYRFAKRLMNIQALAEDVTQDVLLKLWTKKEELDRYHNVEAFAMTITKNRCYDELKSKNHQTESTDAEDLRTTSETPLHLTEINDEMAILNEIINRLPNQQKTVVQLREIEGYEFKEIEQITGMKINAIRTNLSRARNKIKEELTKVYAYGLSKN